MSPSCLGAKEGTIRQDGGQPRGSRGREGGLAPRGLGRGSPWVSGVGSGERGRRRLTPPRVSLGPQALVAELHRRALVEYVRPLLRGRLRCRSARTRSRVAGRLREDAAQLQRLFRRLVSAAGGPRLRNHVSVPRAGAGTSNQTLSQCLVHSDPLRARKHRPFRGDSPLRANAENRGPCPLWGVRSVMCLGSYSAQS